MYVRDRRVGWALCVVTLVLGLAFWPKAPMPAIRQAAAAAVMTLVHGDIADAQETFSQAFLESAERNHAAALEQEWSWTENTVILGHPDPIVTATPRDVEAVFERSERLRTDPAWQRFKKDVADGVFGKGDQGVYYKDQLVLDLERFRLRAAKENILRLPICLNIGDFEETKYPEVALMAYSDTVLDAALERPIIHGR